MYLQGTSDVNLIDFEVKEFIVSKFHCNHCLRGSIHTQTAMVNGVKLTFVGVWVKTPDVGGVMVGMS